MKYEIVKSQGAEFSEWKWGKVPRTITRHGAIRKVGRQAIGLMERLCRRFGTSPRVAINEGESLLVSKGGVK